MSAHFAEDSACAEDSVAHMQTLSCAAPRDLSAIVYRKFSLDEILAARMQKRSCEREEYLAAHLQKIQLRMSRTLAVLMQGIQLHKTYLQKDQLRMCRKFSSVHCTVYAKDSVAHAQMVQSRKLPKIQLYMLRRFSCTCAEDSAKNAQKIQLHMHRTEDSAARAQKI